MDLWEFSDKNISKNENVYKGESITKNDGGIRLKYYEMKKINPLTADKNSISPFIDINKKFYLQAKLMENFTESYHIYNADFHTYFSRYESLKPDELRGYFSWRTKYRNDEVFKAPFTYLLIYIAELINYIGVKSPQDGFSKLKKLENDYPEIKEYDISYLINDFSIYYGLKLCKSNEFCKKLSRVMNGIKNKSFEKILMDLGSLSKYNVAKSRFYLSEYRYIFINALVVIFDEMEKFYKKNRSVPLLVKLFGHEVIEQWRPFDGMVFYSENKIADKKIIINSCEKYILSDGKWYHHVYHEFNLNSKLISEILKTTEYYLRLMVGFSHKIKLSCRSEILREIIENAVRGYLDENGFLNIHKTKPDIAEEVFKPVIVNIDKTKFEDIRKTSDELKEKLIIFEEEEEKEFENISVDEETVSGWGGFVKSLTDIELEILKALLKETEIKSILKRESLMEEVVIEAINEKAITAVNDSIIDYSGIYEEYKCELTEVL